MPVSEPRSDTPDYQGALGPAKLSPKQMRALPIIIAAPNLTQAAEQAGINESTLRRWRRNPLFQEEMERLAAELAETTREELRSVILHGFKVVDELMENPDPMIRLRAASYAISMGIRTMDLAEVLKMEKDGQTS